MYQLLDPSECKTESDAEVMAEEMMDSVDEVSSMQARGSRAKAIRSLSSKLEHLRKKCMRKGWKAPLLILKKGFIILKAVRVSEDSYINELFGI